MKLKENFMDPFTKDLSIDQVYDLSKGAGSKLNIYWAIGLWFKRNN